VQVSLERTDGAAALRAAVHDARIQFDLAKQVRPATAPDGVYLGIPLHLLDTLFDGVQNRAASAKRVYCGPDAGSADGVREHYAHA